MPPVLIVPPALVAPPVFLVPPALVVPARLAPPVVTPPPFVAPPVAVAPPDCPLPASSAGAPPAPAPGSPIRDSPCPSRVSPEHATSPTSSTRNGKDRRALRRSDGRAIIRHSRPRDSVRPRSPACRSAPRLRDSCLRTRRGAPGSRTGRRNSGSTPDTAAPVPPRRTSNGRCRDTARRCRACRRHSRRRWPPPREGSTRSHRMAAPPDSIPARASGSREANASRPSSNKTSRGNPRAPNPHRCTTSPSTRRGSPRWEPPFHSPWDPDCRAPDPVARAWLSPDLQVGPGRNLRCPAPPRCLRRGTSDPRPPCSHRRRRFLHLRSFERTRRPFRRQSAPSPLRSTRRMQRRAQPRAGPFARCSTSGPCSAVAASAPRSVPQVVLGEAYHRAGHAHSVVEVTGARSTRGVV